MSVNKSKNDGKSAKLKRVHTNRQIEFAPQVPLDAMDKEESNCSYICDKINPAFESNIIAVCIVSSNEYAPFAAVLVQSIISNSIPESNYDIVILSDDIYLRNSWRIEKMAVGHQNISIRIVDISKMVEGLSFYTWAHFTSKTYYRLLTPDLFTSYEKVIYLDSDVVVNHDITELYNIDLEGYLLAAAYDTHVVAYCSQNPPLEQREYNIKTLKLEKPELYFQAGVSLYNIKEFKKKHESGYLVTQATKHELRWLDQDLINMLCKGKIKRLPNKWNVMIANNADFVDEYYLPAEMRKEYFEARKDPGIVHYVGRAIPCYTTTPDLYEYFWKYARLTPFYEILLQRMVIDYSDKSESNARMLKYTEELQAECAYLRAQCNALCAKNHIKVPKSKPPFRLRVRSFLKAIAKVLFPANTRRRTVVKRLYNKLIGL